MDNIFDQFDEPGAPSKANPFDQFDDAPAGAASDLGAQVERYEAENPALTRFGQRLERSARNTAAGIQVARAIPAEQQRAALEPYFARIDAGEDWGGLLPKLPSGAVDPAAGLTPGDLDTLRQYQGGDETIRSEIRADVAAQPGKLIGSAMRQSQAAAAIPMNPAAKAVADAQTFGEGARAFAADPIGVAAELGVSSAVPMAAGAVTAILSRNPALAMAVATGGSEYTASLLDGFAAQGVNVSDAAAIEAAISNPEMVANAQRYAAGRGVIVGAGAGLTGAIGGRLVGAASGPVAKGGAAVGEVAANAGIDMGTEAAAQLATTGQVQPGQVLAEGAGGVVTAPVEIGSAMAARGGGQRQQVPPPAPQTAGARPGQQASAVPQAVQAPNPFDKFDASPPARAPGGDPVAAVPAGAVNVDEFFDLTGRGDPSALVAPQPAAPVSQAPAPDQPAAPQVAPASPSAADLAGLMADERPLAEILAERQAQQAPAPVESPPPGAVEARREPGVTSPPAPADAPPAQPVVEGTGERADPVQAATPEAVAVAAERVDQDASPAQREAGNYAKGHIKWQGLDLAIETPKGGTRTATDGSWEVTDFPAHYGYVKRSTGKDGDQVDVYLGDMPQARRVFVIDQIDPATGKFDEHKALAGFDSREAALAAYERAFSDGNGPRRIGAVTVMSAPQFKAWVKNGETKKPVAYEERKAPPAPRPAQRAPLNAIQFLQSLGGIRDDEGHDLIRSRNAQRQNPRFGPLIRSTGRSIDSAGEALWEAGYFGDPDVVPRPGENDVLEMIERGLFGRHAYSIRDLDEVNQRLQAAQAREARSRAASEVDGEIQSRGFAGVTSKERTAATELILLKGYDASDAIDEVMERAYIEDERALKAAIAEAEKRARRGNARRIPFDPTPAAVEQRSAGRGDPDAAQGSNAAQPDSGRTAGVSPPRLQSGNRPQASAGENPALIQPSGPQAGPQPFSEERTEAGQQSVIPGAERISDRALAERQMQGRSRATVAQKPADEGLFDVAGRGQQDLLKPKLQQQPSPDAALDFAAQTLLDLANEDGIFSIPVRTSSSLLTIIAQALPGSSYVGETTRPDERRDSGADHRYSFRTPRAADGGGGRDFHVYTTDDQVWIDVSALREGDRGQLVYAAIADWALNTDRVFVGDPAGMTEAAVMRRTSNMLASALRHGTTRHLAPGEAQQRGNPALGIEPLAWKPEYSERDFFDNLKSLIHTFVATTYNRFPDLDGYRYDFRSNRYVDRRGRPLDAARLDRGKGTPGARGARAGEKTLRRAVFLRSLLEAPDGERSQILERVLNGGRQVARGAGPLFSRPADQQATNQPAAKQPAAIRAERPTGFGRRATPAFRDASAQILADLQELAARMFGPRVRVRELSPDDGLGGATGAFWPDPGNPLIALALAGRDQADIIASLRHEGIHYLRMTGAITARQWRVLGKAARREWREMFDIDARYAGDRARLGLTDAEFQEHLDEEAVAEAFGAYQSGQRFGGGINAIFERIALFLRRAANLLAGRGFRVWEDVFEEIESGRVAWGKDTRPAQAEGAPAYATKELFQRGPYRGLPDNLMGFSRNSPGKPYGEQNWKHEQYVKITFPDGQVHYDAIKGLNKPHAIERAYRNWPGAEIEAATEAQFDEYIRAEDIGLGSPKLQAGPAERTGNLRVGAPNPADVEFLANQARGLIGQAFGQNRPAIRRVLDNWQTVIQDRFLPLKRLQERIAALRGSPIADAENAYLSEEGYTSRAGERLLQLRKRFTEPLFDAIAKARVSHGVTQADVEAFLYARHAPERNAAIAKLHGGGPDAPEAGSGMTNDEARETLNRLKAEGKISALAEIAKIHDAMHAHALATRVELGLMSQADADAWRRAYRYYTPLRGKGEIADAIDPEDETRPNIGSGYGGIRGAESKRALGRSTKAPDLLANSLMLAQEAIIRGEKNQVGLALLKLARDNPDPTFWRVDAVKTRRYVDKDSGAIRVQRDTLPRDDQFYVKENGVEHWITIDHPRLVKNLKNLGADQLGVVFRALAPVMNFLKLVRTGWNPEFIITNALRDLQTGAIHLSNMKVRGLVLATLRDYPKALKAGWGGTEGRADTEWQRYYREFAAAGGKTDSFKIDDLEAARDRLAKELSIRSPGRGPMLKRSIRLVLETVDRANQSVENAIRLSAYVNARRSGFTPMQAASLAKNLTVNFNRRGEWGREMSTLYMFFNASVQGTAAITTNLASRDRAKRAAARRNVLGIVALGFAAEMMNAFLSPEDDDGEKFYDKLTPYEKSRNLIVMNPLSADGNPVKIPLALGYNAFYDFGRNLAAFARGRQGLAETAGNIMTSTLDAFNPVGGAGNPLVIATPTILQPGTEILINRDYKDAPIYPEHRGYDTPPPDSQMYFRSVSPIARWLAEQMNAASGGNEFTPGDVDVSPESLEHVYYFAVGGIGRLAEALVDLPAKVREGDFGSSEVPFLRRLYGAHYEGGDKNRFYDRHDQIVSLSDRLKKLNKDGRKDEADALANENRALLSLRRDAEQTRRSLTTLNKQLAASTDPAERRGIEVKIKAAVDRFNALWREKIGSIE